MSDTEPTVIIDLDAKGPPILVARMDGIITLRVVTDEHRVFVHRFRDGERLRIGRRADAELFLDAPSIGRVQAVIDCRPEAYVLLDGRSANGVRVNGVAIDRHPLAVGDVIGLPPFEIEVMTLGAVPGEREQAFLDALGDDAMRAVYADWLEDQGRHAGAEIVRGRVAYPLAPDTQ